MADQKRGTIVGNTVPAPTFLQAWTLSKVGNWDSWNNNGLTETRVHNDHHALTSRSTLTHPEAYDGNVNQTDDGTAYKFEYDANDRLKTVRKRGNNTVVAQYRYDAFGRRVESNVGGVIARYHYSGQRIVEERDGTDAVAATYTYGLYVDEPLTMIRGGQTYFYHANRLFSTAALTNATGAVSERYSYTAYGQTTTYNAAYGASKTKSRVGNPFAYTGRELDDESGLYHYRGRTFDPLQGRFKQRDPLGYLGGIGLFEYVWSRPSALVDPDGAEPFIPFRGLLRDARDTVVGALKTGGQLVVGTAQTGAQIGQVAVVGTGVVVSTPGKAVQALGKAAEDSQIPIVKNIGITTQSAGQLLESPGTVIQGVGKLDPGMVVQGLGQAGTGALGVAGVGDFIRPWEHVWGQDPSVMFPPKSAKAVGGAAMYIDSLRLTDPDIWRYNKACGYKLWHLYSNMRFARKAGITEIPWFLLIGFMHEVNPIDIAVEWANQGPISWVFDTPGDLAANVLGTGAGLILPPSSHTEAALGMMRWFPPLTPDPWNFRP